MIALSKKSLKIYKKLHSLNKPSILIQIESNDKIHVFLTVLNTTNISTFRDF